jgi:hypothetical protein
MYCVVDYLFDLEKRFRVSFKEFLVPKICVWERDGFRFPCPIFAYVVVVVVVVAVVMVLLLMGNR